MGMEWMMFCWSLQVLIRGFRADEWLQFNHKDTFDDRLNRILDRLSLPNTTRPDLTMMYYDEPDARGDFD